MNDDVRDFCSKYDAYLQPSSRMHRRAQRIDYKMWSESGPELWRHQPYEDVRCVEVHMPEDRFRALVEHDSWLESNRLDSFSNPGLVHHLVREHERETQIRHQYPGVQKAWENYQLMLKLCDEGH